MRGLSHTDQSRTLNTNMYTTMAIYFGSKVHGKLVLLCFFVKLVNYNLKKPKGIQPMVVFHSVCHSSMKKINAKISC